ncbi:hypothetical protein GA0061071_11374 [Kosakonia oryzendophytica]|uniref:Uncharacterized protein n=1 Tax=Kosakonia oryzendophytica TaxID=1005665 RepID=A0A1C4DN71_9ENTR|nr:hypothetical protein [Kosakonia oryzendophytica]SCC32816.1 hypothetical protein GA0061071_11374 [Kosakonia oryzendophytica]
MENRQINKEQLLQLLNLHLQQHPAFEEGMSFDDINVLANSSYDVRANFNFGGNSVAENYNKFGYIYNEVFKDFLEKQEKERLR